MDDYSDHRERLEAIESQLYVVRGLAEKTEREVRHIGIVVGIASVVIIYLLLK
jgi:tetrahydromethanopterin S-methyltransferase subunit G